MGFQSNDAHGGESLQRVVRTPLVAVAFLVGLALTLGSHVAAQPQPPVELPQVPYPDIESAIGVATGAGGTGVATFVFTEGEEPWATLIVDAGSPDGIDRVTVTFSLETETLTIEAEDAEPTNEVTILVNKEFIDAHLESSQNGLIVEVSDAVNYFGLTVSAEAGGTEVYAFVITHFSVQTIKLSPKILNGTLLGPDGLTTMGWASIGAAVTVVLVAAIVALRKRR